MNKALWTVNGTGGRKKFVYDPAVEEEMKRLVRKREADVDSAEVHVAYARKKMEGARSRLKFAKWRLKEANKWLSRSRKGVRR